MHFFLRTSAALPLIFYLSISVAAPTSWQGKPVAELLKSLSADGYQIIFSSDVVHDQMLVLTEPELGQALNGLKDILSAHGLLVEIGPADVWLVRKAAVEEITETSTAPPDQVPLPEIVVTSSLHRLEYANPNTQTSFDRELATRIPGAAEEAVRITSRLPGTAGGGISTRNHIRGGEVNEVLFLLDGLRLYEPFHLKDFQSVATIINSNAIETIDFYTGAYPARFGDRMSGVMNMSLRKPEKSTQTELALSFFNASALSIGTFGEGQQGDWLLAARRGNLDLIADIIDPERGSPDYQDYLLHGGWAFGPRTRFSANLLLSNDKLVLADTDRGETADARYKNQVLWLNWGAEWGERLKSETIVSLSRISTTRSGTLLLPGIVSGSLNELREFDSIGLKQDWVYLPSKNWMFSFGVEGKHQDSLYEFSSTKNVLPPFDELLNNIPVQVRNFDLAPEGAQYSTYAEVRWQLMPQLVVDAGLRWDHQSYTAAENDEQSSPRLSILYQPSERLALRLGWGQYSQAQEINELQVADGLPEFFAAQRAEHVVANLKYRLAKDINVDVSYYRKSFREVRPRFENAFNSLTLLPEIQFDRYRIDPLSAEAKGAELMLSKGDATHDLYWWVGYAWSVVNDKYTGGKLGRAWDQTHAGKAGLSWRRGRWDFSAAGEVHTGWPRIELVAGEAVRNDRYSVFHTLDVRLSREFSLRRGELTAFMEISNLYDRDNPCCTEYSVSTEGGMARAVGRQQNWLPLVPSLGVVWRF